MSATPWLASDPYAMLGRSPSQVGAYHTRRPESRGQAGAPG